MSVADYLNDEPGPYDDEPGITEPEPEPEPEPELELALAAPNGDRAASFVDHARRYAELGWALTPCKGKEAFQTGWQLREPRSPENTAGEWTHAGTKWNLGVVCGPSGVAVLDVDRSDDPDAACFGLLGVDDFPDTPVCRTGSGRLHVYFRDPGGLEKKVRDGFELRVGPHQCNAPPSVNPDTGRAYEWIADRAPWDVELAELPPHLIAFFAASTNGKHAAAAPLGDVIPIGEIDTKLTSLAGSMRRRNASEDAIFAALVETLKQCEKGHTHTEEDCRRIAKSIGKKKPAERPAAAPKSANSYMRSDTGNAEMLADRYSGRIRHVKERSLWIEWQSGRWRPDTTGEVERLAEQVARDRLRAAADIENEDERKKAIAWAISSESNSGIRAMLARARVKPAIVLRAEDLDRDPFALACANGVIDLRTGELRPANPADLISMGTDIPYDPDATCPRWESFLLEIFEGDADLVGWIQRAFGYTATGDTREQVIFVCQGVGRNGKGTALETQKKISGDFGRTASFDTFARSRGDNSARNDLARLHRARYVLASESGEGRRLDEAIVKQLTGGDTVAARFLYAEHFEFVPRFKIWLATNYRPRVDGDDEAIWARVKLVPFNVGFLGREDKTLAQTLEQELPGILAWTVRGAIDWHKNGLGTCAAVENATHAYRLEEDVLGAFIADRCLLEGETAAPALREAYEVFCADAGEKPLAANTLGKRLAKRGIKRGGRSNAYQRISLK